jgi:nucleotide-binding universal stress UspA family protein
VRSPRRILACVDLSAASEPVLAAAVVMAQAFKATVDVLHVREPYAHPTTGGQIAAPGQQGLALFIDDGLLQIAERLKAEGVVCVTNNLDGSPASVIIEHADQINADMILVGTHGRTGAIHLLLGSVAERVVQKAHRPVLVLPVRPGSR